MEISEDEKFCSHIVSYNYDSEGENDEPDEYGDMESEHIRLATNKGKRFTRITRTGRWKRQESQSEMLEKLFLEYLSFLASKHPNEINPLYCY